jgi:hypothetical protein
MLFQYDITILSSCQGETKYQLSLLACIIDEYIQLLFKIIEYSVPMHVCGIWQDYYRASLKYKLRLPAP